MPGHLGTVESRFPAAQRDLMAKLKQEQGMREGGKARPTLLQKPPCDRCLSFSGIPAKTTKQ